MPQEAGDLAGAKPALSPEHQRLAAWAGTWDTKDKARPQPEAPFSESNGMHTVRLEMNGTWLVSDLLTTLFGVPYKAHMQIGFDPRQRKYVGTLIQSVTPELTLMEGTHDEKSKVLTMTYDAPDPASGTTQKLRATWEITGEKTAVMRLYQTAPGGKEFVFLEKAYTKR
jgi:hypothetical protein